MPTSFNPQEHVRQLEDGRDYMDLKWRLLWLRSHEPEASIETQIVPSSEDEIICRAKLTLRSGASVSAHASASRADSANAIEIAEDRALIRALAALGFGAEYIEDDDVELQATPNPPVNLMTARALMDRNEQRYDPEPELDDESPEPETEDDQEEPAPPATLQPASTVDDGPKQPEDISWTKFWAWAKPRGYGTALELGELLGVDVLSHTPGEIRRMIKRYELEHPPGGTE